MQDQAMCNVGAQRSAWFRVARSAALLAMLISVAAEIDARGRGGGGGFRGGGIRGGGSTSFGRGGGDFGRGSYDRGSDSYRSGSSFSRDGNYSRPSKLDSRPSRLEGSRSTDWNAMTKAAPGERTRWDGNTRPASGGSATQLPASRPGGSNSAAQLPANRPGGIGGSGSRPPVNGPGADAGRHWRPDCPKCNDGWDGWVDHPIAAGVVIGAIAGRAAVIGSSYYSLPADCPPYIWNDVYYYSCDGNFYEPQYEGDTVVYVTVPDPSGGQQQPTK